MKSMIAFGILPIFLTTSNAQTLGSRVREIPAPALRDVAMASADTLGFVIYYNPLAIRQVGPLTAAFFRIHEYGHVYLGHLTKMMTIQDSTSRLEMSRKAEMEADEYATRVLARSNPAAIDSIVNRLINFPDPGDSVHLPSIERACNIRNLADKITQQTPEPEGGMTNVNTPDELRNTANRVLQHLADESFYSVTLDLNDELSDMLATQQIVQVWNEATSQLGKFEHLSDIEEEKIGASARLVMRCRFERGDAWVEISFDQEGKIGGVWIRPIEE